MYKKSQLAYQIIMTILRLGYTSALIIIVIVLTKNQISIAVDTSLTENYLLYYGLIYNENLMVTDTVTDRIYPFTIDTLKIKNPDISKELDKGINYGVENKYIAAKLNFKDDKGKLTTIYFNPGDQKGYQDFQVLAETKIQGPGSATERKFTSLILYYEDMIKTGKLDISIIRPNS